MVVVFLCLGHSPIEDPNFVSVEDLDAAVLKMLRQIVFIVEIPLFVREEPETFAQAATFRIGVFLLFVLIAGTTFLAVGYTFHRCVWIVLIFCRIYRVVLFVSCGPVEHQPCSGETRMTSANYDNIFVLIRVYAFHGRKIALSSQKVIRHDNSVLSLLHKRKPLLIKARMQDLFTAIGNNHSFGSELHCGFLFGEDDMSVLVILLDNTLLFDCRHQHIPIQKVLYSRYSVTWVKDLFLHNCLDVLEDVISGIVQECANN